MLLADIPEFKSYQKVSVFVRDHLSMQFGDIRSIAIPSPDLGGALSRCGYLEAARGRFDAERNQFVEHVPIEQAMQYLAKLAPEIH